MTAKRAQPQETPPDLPPQKAYAALKEQMARLQALKGQRHDAAENDEAQFYQFTQKILIRAFGSTSQNFKYFLRANSAGTSQMVASIDGHYYDTSAQDQQNFEARIAAYETVLRSSLDELKMDLSDDEVKGVYEPGQEYEFYADVKRLVALARRELFVIDPYLSTEIFDVYANGIPRTVQFRLLGARVPPAVVALGQKYASGGNFQFRRSDSLHDRMIFADSRVWVCGQSLKDAAVKKPTYVVEMDEPSLLQIYEDIWNKSQSLV